MSTNQEFFDQSPLGAAFHRQSLKEPVPARKAETKQNPAITEAVSQLKQIGLPVTTENILAAAKLTAERKPVNAHNLNLMTRIKQRDLPTSAPAAINQAQREALLKILNDPREIAAIAAEIGN